MTVHELIEHLQGMNYDPEMEVFVRNQQYFSEIRGITTEKVPWVVPNVVVVIS